ncbi:Uncharacterised protein [Mycobacteroides abscessus subsp. abscessus]|nr:Uncharacterised protein [Mycobacteroides abscessus subsp. abscessus]
MVVDRSSRNPGFAGDVVEGHLAEASGGEQFSR